MDAVTSRQPLQGRPPLRARGSGSGPPGPQGPAGPAGPAGATGATGTRGSLWYTGSGAPGTIAGVLTGDLYLDTASGDVYQY